MGTVCEHRNLNLAWYLRHRRHLRWKLVPYLRVKRWLSDRCEVCGRRFRWREARFGTGWESRGVLHDPCHRVRHLRGQVADLAKYVRGEADQTERWRVEYAWLGDDPKSVPHWRDMGVGK